MKIQNMLILLSICLVGSMYAAAEVALETETGTVKERQVTVTVCNSDLQSYYFKISKNVKGLSSDPVVWDGIPEVKGTDVNLPVSDYHIRISIYSEKPSAGKRIVSLGYIFIAPDEVKNLRRIRLVVYAGTMKSLYLEDRIDLEFNDGSIREKVFKRRYVL